MTINWQTLWDTHRGKFGDFSEYQRRGLEKGLRILGVTLPKADKIPTVRFDEAKEMVAQKYQRKEI